MLCLDELLAKNKFLQDNPDLISKVEKDIEGEVSLHWFVTRDAHFLYKNTPTSPKEKEEKEMRTIYFVYLMRLTQICHIEKEKKVSLEIKYVYNSVQIRY